MEAIMASKADLPPLSGDDVVLLRLTQCSLQIKEVILHSSEIAFALSRMTEARCDPSPSWANGAIILVPLTAEQVEESGIQLRPHNIVALRSDQDSIRQALGHLPKRKRPQVR